MNDIPASVSRSPHPFGWQDYLIIGIAAVLIGAAGLAGIGDAVPAAVWEQRM